MTLAFPKISEQKIASYKEKLNISDTLARVLINRNMSIQNATSVLHKNYINIEDPTQIVNLEAATSVIETFLKNKNADIWVFGDYDCDGIMATYTLTMALNEIRQGSVYGFVPERCEGYGLNMHFVNEIIAKYQGNEENILVITVDNGITKTEEIKKLQKHQISVIVTDHHVSQNEVPDCIIVDPHNRKVPQEYGHHLCGCGVAFKLVQNLFDRFNISNIEKYTPCLAIATLADVMPMAQENIELIQFGLDVINSDNCPIPISHFKNFLGKDKIDSADILWDIAPTINACGRMGKANLAIQFLYESDIDLSLDLFEEITLLNENRKAKTKSAQKIIESYNIQGKNFALITINDQVPEGILGILAGKSVEYFNKPSLILMEKEDCYQGSVRSCNAINLQTIFPALKEKSLIEEFGGHEMAAGITIKKDKLREFEAELNKIEITESQKEEKTIVVDDKITIKQFTKNLYEELMQLPYGGNFTQPVFILQDVEITSAKRSTNNPNHICFKIKYNKSTFDLWAWGMAKKYDELNKPKTLSFIGSLVRDFRNSKKYTLQVIDFQ